MEIDGLLEIFVFQFEEKGKFGGAKAISRKLVVDGGNSKPAIQTKPK